MEELQEKAPEFTVASIRRLVEVFYGSVRNDPELGPIFERVVGRSAGGWAPHLDTMTAFWCAVLLHQPGYKGDPRGAHARVQDLEGRHFVRWLELFRTEARRVFADEPAREVIACAESIGVNLRRAIAV